MKKTIIIINEIILFFTDYLATFSLGKYRTNSGMAIVRMDAIGDFILWLDTAKEYRRLYPDQKITLIANSIWSGMAQNFPFWDDVWPIELRRFTRNLPYRWRMLRKIRKAGFAVALQPTYSRAFLHGDSVIRASCAIERIGSVGDLSNIASFHKTISDRWYTRQIPATQQPLMELERNAEFVSNLSGGICSAKLPELPVFTTLPEQLKPIRDYFIIFPGASSPVKQWPVASFAAVAEQLQRQYGWLAVLCGSPAEGPLCQTVAEASSAAFLDLAGQTTLSELSEIIRDAKCLIGNDTSAIHFASAVGTPSICILGGGHYGRFMPYPEILPGNKPVAVTQAMSCFHCNWCCTQPHVPSGPVPCVSAISVEQVLEEVHALFDQPAISKSAMD